MKVKILGEEGYEFALLGISKSFKIRSIPHEEWWSLERFIKMKKTARGMAHKDGGHNKFLESIMVWMDIEAPRGFWQEYDTYRVGVTKQSDSTMHTIQKRPTTKDDYEPNTDMIIINRFNDILFDATDGFAKKGRLTGDVLQKVKWALPEGFLQSRVVCINYKTLRNQIIQRYNHNLVQWQMYITDLYTQLSHPELLPNIKYYKG